MTYIIYTLLSGIAAWILSICFRAQELKKEIILMPKQLITQIALFIAFALIFSEFFSGISINLWFITLWWMTIYIIFSSASYYAVQVFYEYFSWNKMFATESEMKKYIEKLERDKF